MKIKIYMIAVASTLIVACGGSGTSTEADKATVSENKAASDNFAAGKELIVKSDCLGCHKEQEKLVGPAYVDVAKKYAATAENVTLLAGKIIAGGSGVWGQIPMTPHPQIAEADAETMVKYILSLK
nr:c-type cytochrome [Pseudopedobacter sp.]